MLTKSTRKRLAEWSKTPEGREAYEKVAEEMRKQIVPNDLKEAAEEYFQKVKAEFLRTLEHPTAKDCFIAGAKWQKQHDAELIEIAYNDGITIGMTKQKEQMMQEAVEGEYDSYPAAIYLDVPIPKMNHGDKVRIIIIKDDGKSD